MTAMIPVVDVSRYQGKIRWRTMIDAGVKGFILRATHALAKDVRLDEYVSGLRAEGFDMSQVGFYTFCNPSRASAQDSAKFLIETLVKSFGSTDTFVMMDVENYEQDAGQLPVIRGERFGRWLQDFVQVLHDLAPGLRVVFYSNAAYWDTWVQVPWFNTYDIIVPRYLEYKENGIQPPRDPALWEGWAFSYKARPIQPRAWDRSDGWQFSAGWNRMGGTYGVQSRDLDLNVVDADAWSRWTMPKPVYVNPPTELVEDSVLEDVMKPEIHRFAGYTNQFLFAYGQYTHLTGVTAERYGAAGFPKVLLDAHPQGIRAALAQSGLMWSDLVEGGPLDKF